MRDIEISDLKSDINCVQRWFPHGHRDMVNLELSPYTVSIDLRRGIIDTETDVSFVEQLLELPNGNNIAYDINEFFIEMSSKLLHSRATYETVDEIQRQLCTINKLLESKYPEYRMVVSNVNAKWR